MWVKTLSTATIKALFGRINSLDGPTRAYDLLEWNVTDQYSFQETQTGDALYFTSGSTTYNNWINVIVTYEKAGMLPNIYRFYVNGTQIGGDNLTFTNLSATTNYINYIGASVLGGGYWFNGRAKKVIYTHGIITQDQATRISNGEDITV